MRVHVFKYRREYMMKEKRKNEYLKREESERRNYSCYLLLLILILLARFLLVSFQRSVFYFLESYCCTKENNRDRTLLNRERYTIYPQHLEPSNKSIPSD